MLKKILAISGRPGLYELINQGKNCIIVESLTSPRKRTPVFNTEKVMSLGDIAIYTTGDEKPLNEVFEALKVKFDGGKIDIKDLEKNGKLRELFAEILPDFDDERVRTSDIKKVYQWYNTLIENGITDFLESDSDAAENNSEEKPAEEKAE